jgi:hypothetical protein
MGGRRFLFVLASAIVVTAQASNAGLAEPLSRGACSKAKAGLVQGNYACVRTGNAWTWRLLATSSAPAATAAPATTTAAPSPFPSVLGRWTGAFDQVNYPTGPYDMTIVIERQAGSSFVGKAIWPTLRNSITEIKGEVVSSTGDVIEQTKWRFLSDRVPLAGGVLIKFSDTSLLQGSSITLGDLYLGRIAPSGAFDCVGFRDIQASEPIGRCVTLAKVG